jgi:hypothetical protein
MNIRREGLIILAVLAGILLIASAIGFVLHLRLRDSASKPAIDNLNARIRAWWLMVIVVGGAILAGRNAVIALFSFISFATLREFITLTPTRRADHGALFIIFFVVLPMQYVLIWMNWYGFFSILIPVYAFLILPTLAVVFADSKNFLARTSETQWCLMICVYCISHVPALWTVRAPSDRPPHLAIEDRGRICGRRGIRHDSGSEPLADYSVQHLASCRDGTRDHADGIPGRTGDVGDQTRSRREGLGTSHRGPRRHAGPARFGVLLRADLLSPDEVFLRGLSGPHRPGVSVISPASCRLRLRPALGVPSRRLPGYRRG